MTVLTGITGCGLQLLTVAAACENERGDESIGLLSRTSPTGLDTLPALTNLKRVNPHMEEKMIDIGKALEALNAAEIYGGVEPDTAVLDLEDYDIIRSALLEAQNELEEKVCTIHALRDERNDLQKELAHRERAMVELAKQVDGDKCPYHITPKWCLDCRYTPSHSDACINARIEWAMKKTEE